MENTNNTADRELRISRLMHAPVELVWEVWTQPNHIKNWWGPDGFTSTIHQMVLEAGGEWDLTMHGPDGTDYKNKSVFTEIIPLQKIVYEHVSGPVFTATIIFEAKGESTQMHWHMLFRNREEFVQTVKTFKADEGLRQNIEKLNLYVQAQQQLYKQLKPADTTRVSTYLNFPGNTEEAFLFYKKVFRSEFNGGLQRFGDIPDGDGTPPLSEEDKKLILHIELPILGGRHVLMATDAPASMGFTLTQGNNMHIMLEPETREETKRLFDALAEGGKISMPLQDMFWGAYYGSCTDQYGINWMVNFAGK